MTAARFAYADPPYLGKAEYYRAHHRDAMAWNDPETYRQLITLLQTVFPDGWALSLSEPSLRTILPMCPSKARVAAWITDRPRFAGKTIAVRKHFEPVIFCGGRPDDETGNRAADYIVTKQQRLPPDHQRYALIKGEIRSGKTFVGRKPKAFAMWIFDILGVRPEDEFVDLFPGSGAVTEAYHERFGRRSCLQPGDHGLLGQ